MTIKQQGGIFGRNPTFNDVDVEGDFTVDTNTLHVDSTNNRVGVKTVTPAAALEVVGSAILGDSSASEILLLDLKNTSVDAAAGVLQNFTLVQAGGSAKTAAQIKAIKTNTWGSNASTDSALTFSTIGANTFAERLRVDKSGNVLVNTGNLIIGTSGKGIDFSATSGTGTSELFDDYEEGTFTPAITFSGGDGTGSWSYSTQNGQYTKVGNTVRAAFQIRLSAFTKGTAGGTPRISGLPFNFGVELCTGTIGLFNASFSSQPIIVGVTGTAQMDMLRIQDNNVWAALNDPDANAQYFGVIVYQAS